MNTVGQITPDFRPSQIEKNLEEIKGIAAAKQEVPAKRAQNRVEQLFNTTTTTPEELPKRVGTQLNTYA